jgi:hypothetical protein
METKPIKPNFFIIGAPKCGTTALSEYLRSHPNVFISEPKEPHYFSTDIQTRYAIRNLDDYLACFSKATKQHLAIGEASVAYLSSHIATKKILEFNPDARFIVMLRNPIELAHSWHSEALYNSYEIEKNFEQAWHLQEDRAAGCNIPRVCPDPKLLMYRDIATIGSQMERLFQHVPRERVHVIFFDDFKTDTAGIYEGVLRFLKLPSDKRTDFPVINESKVVRYPVLMELSHWVAYAKKQLGITKGLGILEKVNVPRKSRPVLSASLKHELFEHFQPEVVKLEQLMGRDLSAWKRHAPAVK